ncbi:hypothetical protein GE21DRAFT_1344387 [Neurospora crassa]|nr:hypothetical protein GE21DRAFT_1344387 [Neurospora crassa]
MPIVNGDNVGAYAHGFPLRMMALILYQQGRRNVGFHSIGMIHRGISPSSFWRCSCDLKSSHEPLLIKRTAAAARTAR